MAGQRCEQFKLYSYITPREDCVRPRERPLCGTEPNPTHSTAQRGLYGRATRGLARQE